ncbi:hypothetical protein SASPL_129999 [Salvia splendens]|uniref:Uncharacterized protein n=1 Tax=Salvia splendens TaxID=180675 RepID=A0A8X8X6H0_SALSN|nr:hypothetical protein SASPL_129999 [Salvia splendens]
MSERPVPRRHSPWVDEEVYKREVKAHRCNDRVEDVIYVNNVNLVARLYLKATLSKQFQPLSSYSISACDQNQGTEEPTDPFVYLDLDPPKREAKPE